MQTRYASSLWSTVPKSYVVSGSIETIASPNAPHHRLLPPTHPPLQKLRAFDGDALFQQILKHVLKLRHVKRTAQRVSKIGILAHQIPDEKCYGCSLTFSKHICDHFSVFTGRGRRHRRPLRGKDHRTLRFHRPTYLACPAADPCGGSTPCMK